MTNRSGMAKPRKSMFTSTARLAGLSRRAASRRDAGFMRRRRREIDDVLDDENMPPDQRTVDHVGEAQRTGARAGSVACRPDELQLGGDGKASKQVGCENGRALEDDDHHERRVDFLIGAGDLSAELAHASRDSG